MNEHEDRKARFKEAHESISDDALWALEQQAKIATANLFMMYGNKAVEGGAGVAFAVARAHEAAFIWLVSEGYVELTDKAKVTAEELAKRKEAAKRDDGMLDASDASIGIPGQYL